MREAKSTHLQSEKETFKCTDGSEFEALQCACWNWTPVF